MRKVYVEAKVRLIINMDDGVEVGDVIDDLDYDFKAAAGSGATIEDSELRHYEVVDAK